MAKLKLGVLSIFLLLCVTACSLELAGKVNLDGTICFGNCGDNTKE